MKKILHAYYGLLALTAFLVFVEPALCAITLLLIMMCILMMWDE